jgi:hypothetical protein
MRVVKSLKELEVSIFDFIIIGSGIAAQSVMSGISKKYKILLIDGGDVEYTERHRLLQSSEEGGHYTDNWWGSHWERRYGGNSRIWGGWLARFHEADFKERYNSPKWPIKLNDLEEFYKKAAIFHNRAEIEINKWPKKTLPGDFLLNPQSTGVSLKLKNPEKDTKNGVAVFNVNTIKLESNNRSDIDGITVSDENFQIKSLNIRANQCVILAAGCLGNTQILLQPSSDSSIPIGNESNMVGKFLMEHTHCRNAKVLIEKKFVYLSAKSSSSYASSFCLTDSFKVKEGLLGCGITLPMSNVRKVDKSPMNKFYSERFNKDFLEVDAVAQAEQRPLSTNRAILLHKKNQANMFKLKTHFAFSNIDLYSIHKTTELFGKFLYENKAGLVKINNNGIYRESSGGGHTMGTTKMSSSIKDGVVDKNCKVHSYSNLYIAGSSVFSSGGSVNPTLTISALAIRLGEYLSKNKDNE